MDKLLYASCLVSAAALVLTVVLCIKNRYGEDGLVCIRETWVTALMAVMLIALGVFIVYMKLADPTVSGTDANSYWFVAGFSLLCHLMGDFTILFTFVKRVVLFEDSVEACSVLGKKTRVAWKDITKVDKSMMSKAIKMTDVHGNTLSVSGDDKSLKRFTEIAREKLKASQGSDLLRNVESRLRGPRL